MKELYELKEKLCDELKGYSKKDMTAGTLDVVDKLAHAAKNLDKVIEGYNSKYSGRYDGPMVSNSRGYARREPMGRYANNGYSYDGDIMGELRELMEEAPDERTKQEFKRFIQKLEGI